MAMELDQLEAFVAIVRRGGFTRAAAVLHLSQPAISRRIQLLEHEVAAPLFERLPDGVRLSAAGSALLPHAEAVLAAMRDGAEAVRALRGEAHGPITLAIVGTLASTPLARRLRRFRARHPAVDLQVRTALSTEVSALVLRGEAVLGLRYNRDPHPELVATKVHDEQMVAIAAPDHPLAKRRRIAPRVLAAERWLAFPPRATPEPYSSAIAQGLAACGVTATEIVPIDSLTAQKRMVEAGFGLALVPRSAVDEELRTGSLRVLHVPVLRVTTPVVLVYRRRGFQSGAVQALRALLEAGIVGP